MTKRILQITHWRVVWIKREARNLLPLERILINSLWLCDQTNHLCTHDLFFLLLLKSHQQALPALQPPHKGVLVFGELNLVLDSCTVQPILLPFCVRENGEWRDECFFGNDRDTYCAPNYCRSNTYSSFAFLKQNKICSFLQFVLL